MNPMGIASAGLKFGTGLFKTIFGAVKKNKGEDDLAALKHPLYDTPESVKKFDTMSSMMAMQGLPGEQLMKDQTQQTTANTLAAAQDYGTSDDVYKAQIAENNQMNQISMESAKQRLDNQLYRLEALKVMGDYEDKKFDYNVNIPYQEARKQALDKIGAGTQTMMNGLDSMGDTASSVATTMGGGDDAQGGNTAVSGAQVRGGGTTARGTGSSMMSNGIGLMLSRTRSPLTMFNQSQLAF